MKIVYPLFLVGPDYRPPVVCANSGTPKRDALDDFDFDRSLFHPLSEFAPRVQLSVRAEYDLTDEEVGATLAFIDTLLARRHS